jgi:O-methyltransferase
MRKRIHRLLSASAGRIGIDRPRVDRGGPYPNEIDDVEIWQQVAPYTMTSPERIQALVDSVRYLERHHIAGAFVECGVWRGGSMMAAALALSGDTNRELYLFDTYEGMPPPGNLDIDYSGASAVAQIANDPSRVGAIAAVAHLDEVRRNMASTGYPDSQVHYIEGKVEDTVPKLAPGQIALLRLDTDWYESTHHELLHLFPRVVSGGVLIVDDYGHWKGARQAVDDYLDATGIRLLLCRIDFTGRIAVVP